ncbi:MAG: hypothetical protein ABEL76_05595 [Bradymonadaceae bacterium]
MDLDDLEIEFACGQSWSDLVGFGARRHCEQCEREVVNLSEMTEEEARDLLSGDDPPCARIEVDGDGELQFQEESQLRIQRKGARRLLLGAALALPLGSGVSMLGADSLERRVRQRVSYLQPTSEDASRLEEPIAAFADAEQQFDELLDLVGHLNGRDARPGREDSTGPDHASEDAPAPPSTNSSAESKDALASSDPADEPPTNRSPPDRPKKTKPEPDATDESADDPYADLTEQQEIMGYMVGPDG